MCILLSKAQGLWEALPRTLSRRRGWITLRIHPALVGGEFCAIRYVSPITLPVAFNSHLIGACRVSTLPCRP